MEFQPLTAAVLQDLKGSRGELGSGAARNGLGVMSAASATRNNLLRHGFEWASSPIGASSHRYDHPALPSLVDASQHRRTGTPRGTVFVPAAPSGMSYPSRMVPVDYHEHLRRQLGFMARSCEAFDCGHEDEAVRVAVSIRVLFHQTRNSTPLLTHLRSRHIRVLSTCLDIVAKFRDPWLIGQRPQFFNGMGQYAPGQTPPYRPKLGNSYSHYSLPADDWWKQPVFILDPKTWVSRKDVVLTAANKDGGAHVDEELTAEYERLVSSGDLGYLVTREGDEETSTPVTGHHYVALRQMGHELLNSPELLALAR